MDEKWYIRGTRFNIVSVKKERKIKWIRDTSSYLLYQCKQLMAVSHISRPCALPGIVTWAGRVVHKSASSRELVLLSTSRHRHVNWSCCPQVGRVDFFLVLQVFFHMLVHFIIWPVLPSSCSTEGRLYAAFANVCLIFLNCMRCEYV